MADQTHLSWMTPWSHVVNIVDMHFDTVALLICRLVQGADSIKRCHLASIGNPIVEIRRSYDRLISTMGFPSKTTSLY